MRSEDRKYRLFILGAGFSKHAGLPLGNELFSDVLRHIRRAGMYENIVKPDLDRFCEYKTATTGRLHSEDDVDYEEFISFLDVEHFLGLQGSDTWSNHGNLSQVVLKNYIARVLHERTNAVPEESTVPYLEFAHQLRPGDYVLTFNYDTLVEQYLEQAGKRYRLFPTRYHQVNASGGIVDHDTEEIVVLKMHGSIDWFDIQPYEDLQAYLNNVNSLFSSAKHPIFSQWELFRPTKIVQGLYPEKSALSKIYRVRNLETYWEQQAITSQAPLILAPSYSKIVYANPLKDFWYGFNNAGLFNGSLAIVGFSLPRHDEYIRQALYAAVTNFQSYDPGLASLAKGRFKMVDYRPTDAARAELEERYRFVDWAKAECFMEGFGPEAVRFLFDE